MLSWPWVRPQISAVTPIGARSALFHPRRNPRRHPICLPHNSTVRDCRSLYRHAEPLIMPILLYHGSADTMILVEESRRSADRLADRKNSLYRELPRKP